MRAPRQEGLPDAAIRGERVRALELALITWESIMVCSDVNRTDEGRGAEKLQREPNFDVIDYSWYYISSLSCGPSRLKPHRSEINSDTPRPIPASSALDLTGPLMSPLTVGAW